MLWRPRFAFRANCETRTPRNDDDARMTTRLDPVAHAPREPARERAAEHPEPRAPLVPRDGDFGAAVVAPPTPCAPRSHPLAYYYLVQRERGRGRRVVLRVGRRRRRGGGGVLRVRVRDGEQRRGAAQAVHRRRRLDRAHVAARELERDVGELGAKPVDLKAHL